MKGYAFVSRYFNHCTVPKDTLDMIEKEAEIRRNAQVCFRSMNEHRDGEVQPLTP